MKQLRDYTSILSGLLKDQHLQEVATYRLMHFVVQQPVEDGVLLYNVLTRAVALLSPEEARKMEKNPAAVPELVAMWSAVPMDHDDRLLAQEVRAVGKMLENPVRSIKGFTILTTTDCNARCFYCYEKGRRRIPMLEETALKVADFILQNRPDYMVKLRWFGGEPLYNKGVISLICGKLKDAGVEYKSYMVSNGYLFDEVTVDEAVRLWNIQKVQITLDGTEEVYNRSKAFIYPDGSAYRRVLGNIHRLLGAGIRVTVRLNIDRHNANDDWFGYIDSPERDESMLAGFKRVREEIDACAECPFYPECFCLVLCEETVHCYPKEREEMLLQAREQLLDFYQKKCDKVPD